MDITQSDHKPVFAQILIPIKLVRAEIKKRIKQEIFEEIQMIHINYLNSYEIVPESIQFLEVYYKVQQRAAIKIINKSESKMVYSLCHDELSWLKFSNETCVILPGETSQIDVFVRFGPREAQIANYQSEYLISSLKIKIIGSTDKIIPIQADFKSCFGSSFHDLVKITAPISSLKGNIKENASRHLSSIELPKELTKLIEFFKESQQSLEDLFEIPPDPNEIIEIRLALDNMTEINRSTGAQALFSVLLEIIGSLPRPLLNIRDFDQFIKENEEIVGKSLASILRLKLDPVQRNCIFYLLEFLKFIYFKCRMLLDDLIEEFIHPLLHVKRISKEIIQMSRRKLYLKLLICE